MKKYRIETLGCKVNQYETQAIEEILKKIDYTSAEEGEEADVCIINTCTVTHTGDRKSRQWISRLKRENPDAKIVVMGCYAQVAADELETRPDVDLLIGSKNKEELPHYLECLERGEGPINAVTPMDNRSAFADLTVTETHEKTRATLKVQDGCSQFCSYCIIPYARGPVRSRDFEEVRTELKVMAEKGFKEVVLTGIHLASYGIDTEKETLIDVIRLAQETEGIERIRLSSLEPGIITEEFMDAVKDMDKLCDHFHLSLQSGSDSVLERMNRKYTTTQYKAAIDRIRAVYPHAGITTDIICGFPGESEEEWKETMEFVKTIGFSRIHSFNYSPRKHTPAQKMPGQVLPDVKKARHQELTALAKKMEADFFNRQIGREVDVLVEEEISTGVFSGYTTNYIPVHIEGNLAHNEIVTVTLLENQGDFIKYNSN